jgi:hypothetical protein
LLRLNYRIRLKIVGFREFKVGSVNFFFFSREKKKKSYIFVEKVRTARRRDAAAAVGRVTVGEKVLTGSH